MLKEDSVRPGKVSHWLLRQDFGVRLTGQEAVQLDEQLQVDVVTLWRLAVSAANMVCVKIDTYIKPPSAYVRYALCILALRRKITAQRF